MATVVALGAALTSNENLFILQSDRPGLTLDEAYRLVGNKDWHDLMEFMRSEAEQQDRDAGGNQ